MHCLSTARSTRWLQKPLTSARMASPRGSKTMPAVRLIEAKLPDFGIPRERPQLPQSIYTARFESLQKARRDAGLDVVVIYADREHSANLCWLTGFDPRFEEALLILAPGATPTILAGPENLGRARSAAIEVEARLYPPFGLMGQDRSTT